MIIRMMLFISIFVSLSSCATQKISIIKQKNESIESENSTILNPQNNLNANVPATNPGSDELTPCFEFDKQEYCLKWGSVDGTITNEYLRAGETVDAWVRMITFKEYAGTKELKDFLPNYMQAVRPLLALKPEILGPKVKKHKDEMMLLLLLLAPDKSHYEYVVHRVYTDEEGPVKSVIFSLRIPFSNEVLFNEVMDNRGTWMEELGRLELSAISKMPEP